MVSPLVEVEREALRLKNAGKLMDAIRNFERIVSENPEWEHGSPFFNMAQCFEDLGEVASADKNYLESLKRSPRNPYFLGSYASFLLLTEKHESALARFMELKAVYDSMGDKIGSDDATRTIAGIRETLCRSSV